MISRTKSHINKETVMRLCEKAGIKNIKSISPLGAGEFNAVYEITADRAYVLKIAPSSQTPVMTHEKNMMQSEIYWYDIIRTQTNIKVPDVYYTDFSKSVIPSDWFIMEKLEGVPRNEIKANETELLEKTAHMLAQIHKIKNDTYGYVQNMLYDNWYAALTSIIQNMLEDAKRAGRKSKNGERLLAYAVQYKSMLEKIPCCMVNYDLWDPNIICRHNENHELELQWIDPERSFWGDRIFDFICLENPASFLNKKTRSITFYNQKADTPIILNKETEIRFAFAMGLLAMIQEIEKYYRYTPLLYGWWRNTGGSKYYYSAAFKILKSSRKNYKYN